MPSSRLGYLQARGKARTPSRASFWAVLNGKEYTLRSQSSLECTTQEAAKLGFDFRFEVVEGHLPFLIGLSLCKQWREFSVLDTINCP